MTSLVSLRWYGGKHYHRAWINDVLGPGPDIYAEPFFGMGSVLLDREPAIQEIVSDVNDRVVNWWKVLQTQVEEMAEAVTSIPTSRSEFKRAVERMDDGSPLERAVAFHTVVTQSRMATDVLPHWRISSGRMQSLQPGYTDRLRRVAKRVRFLAIDNRCATSLLQATANKPHAVVYCDPPYWGEANVKHYMGTPIDVGELSDLLLAQKGRCAVSGYGDQWDHLGWERHERDTKLYVRGDLGDRTEVLWCNGRGGGPQSQLRLEL